MLKVTVQRASDLPDVDTFGKSDPYVKISFQGNEQKTEVQDNTLDPVWNQDLQWDLAGKPLSPDDMLSVQVKDYEKVKIMRKVLGKVEVPLGELLSNKEIERTYDLVDGKNNPTLGKLMLKLQYQAPPGSEPSGGGEEGGGEEEAGGEEGDEDEEEEEGGEEGGAPGLPGQPKKKRKRRKRSRRGGRKWSTKVQDFQIRVRVIEGRQLLGSNIHPVVRVTVNGQQRETTVKKSTNKPVYNQTFFYNFHLSEAELFDELLTLEVFNSRKLRSDSLLGSFECDIGGIFEMKGHAFVRKWVLLSAPADKDEDEEEGKSKRSRGGDTPAGYLKITAMVLGPGDEPPPAASAEPKDTEDDIESNLLMPVGVTRQSAVFTLKVYQAEDLPQMDTGIGRSFKKFFSFFSSDDEKEEDKGKKGLVDPYMEFSFCGKKQKTAIIYHESNPEFKTFLKIPLMFPSMCERLRLQMFDWDRGSSDDCIGTAFINLSSIAGRGESDEGFLPTFGPCFVNFYGSTREFTNLPDEHDDLNMGIGEGCAYRGRVLVELQTTLNENIKQATGQVSPEDIIAAQPFLRREKYKLFVCFYEALMVSETDAPVEFEVSVGNCGNKFDESVAPCNTPPCNAVYDGCYYYYLPWGQEKPCVCVECSWEDIAFRLEPMNIINRMAENLREALNRLNQAVELSEVSDDPKLKDMLSSLFDNLVRDCRKELNRFQQEIPKLPGKRNRLDTKLHQMRIDEFNFLLEDVGALQWKLQPPLEGEEKDEVDMKEMLSEIASFAQRIEDLAIEPQVSMPDVIIWMISGEKRIAYYRMPAHDVLFSETEVACGKFCGKTIELQLKYPGKKGQDVKEHPEIPAKLRAEIWLGLEKQQQYWTGRPKTEGDFCVYAETYENEVKIISKWTNNKLTRPRFSDAAGELELPQDKFIPPEGWKFEGGWQKKPELSLFHDPDEGHKEFVVEVFENQSRSFPGGDFKPADQNWSDANGEDVPPPATQQPPPGWAWKTPEWETDKNRACDADGWEYTVNPTYGVYGAVVKAYHMFRRRRLVRMRQLVDPKATKKQDQLQKLLAEGWGYAPLFNMKFHAKEKKMDFCRRRRWLMKMVPISGEIDGFSCKLPPILRVQLKSKDSESALCLSPRMFVSFKQPHKYQLWVYIYQARDLIAKDESGMNDPYARVAFANQSQITNIINQTPCPTWDQTLIYSPVEISEDPANVKRNPPSVVVELFDRDKNSLGKDDYLGRCVFYPKVRLKGVESPEARLLWQKVKRGDQDGGEVLVDAELFLDEGAKLPLPPSKRGDVYPVRSIVRPVVQRTAVEVLCWGVRNMKKFQMVKVTSPVIEFECMGAIIPSQTIENTKKTPNFAEPILERKILNLPVDDLYSPPINIRVRDNRAFGRKPLVGIHSVRSLSHFKCKLPSSQRPDESEVDEVLVDLTDSTPQKKIWPEITDAGAAPPADEKKAKGKEKEGAKKKIDEGNRFDWWSKYFASLAGAGGAAKSSKGEKLVGLFTSDKAENQADFNDHSRKYLSKGYDTLKVYHKELEKVPEFKGFNDFIATFPLRRGKTKSPKDDEEDDTNVGEFKGAFRIYPIPDEVTDVSELPETMFTNLPSTDPIECTIRVYVVLATELQPQDPSGLADPYLIVSLGKKKYDEQDNFKPNTLNPVFGKMFEFKAEIPKVKDLKIQVMDYDYLSRDDLIGETVIDLEQRLLSRFHAHCGLQRTYFTSGPNAWRNCEKPFSILEKYCESTLKPFTLFEGKKENPDRIVIADREYTLAQFEEGTPPAGEVGPAHERLALHILHTFNLVPEHIETRSLYSPVQPDIEQGKIQLWVDIFSKEAGSPKPPVVIDERKPVKQELRVIIWNTTDVVLEEESITGEKMSDIYVKGWIDVINDKERTDTHYRSLDGDGNFNWRMVFPFDYLPIEKKVVVKKKEHFWSLDETEEKATAKLKIQIWENDTFSSDDFIGQLELNLNELAKPCADPDHCGNPRKDPGLNGKTMDLFTQKSTKGWWACYKPGVPEPQGKVEMTVEVLAGWEAEAKPAGQGREDPNQHPVLEEPNRPATSFLWFTSPFKTLKYIIWRRYKWIILLLLILIIVALLIGIFIYSMPGYTVKKMFGV